VVQALIVLVALEVAVEVLAQSVAALLAHHSPQMLDSQVEQTGVMDYNRQSPVLLLIMQVVAAVAVFKVAKKVVMAVQEAAAVVVQLPQVLEQILPVVSMAVEPV